MSTNRFASTIMTSTPSVTFLFIIFKRNANTSFNKLLLEERCTGCIFLDLHNVINYQTHNEANSLNITTFQMTRYIQKQASTEPDLRNVPTVRKSHLDWR